MKRTVKNLLLSLLAPAVLAMSAGAASFPVSYTDEAGVTRWGYMTDSGGRLIDFVYSSAGEFGRNGLACVTNETGKFALLREDGKLATDWMQPPKSTSADDVYQALDYGGRIDYYDNTGELVGSIEGAEGFPGDGLVVTGVRSGRKTLYGYRALQPKTEETPAEETTEKAEQSAAGTEAGQSAAKPESATGTEAGQTAAKPEDTAGAEAEQSAAGTEAAETETAADAEESLFAIEPKYLAAGAFHKGRALVQNERGSYEIINTQGRTLRELPEGTKPTALDIYADNIVILEMKGKYALYSLDTMQFATSFSYDEILPFDQRTARCRVGNLWGLLRANGTLVLEPTYPYLSYMGDGVYAARGTDPGAVALSESGEVLYATDMYVGGFQTFIHGVSWYGGLDGSVVFFNSIGTLAVTFENVENPQVLTKSTVRFTRDGADCCVNLKTGEVIFSNTRNYTLENGLKISAEEYEKYLGMSADGTEYIYHVEYPQISGHRDEAVEAKINDEIRSFFVKGPSGTEERSLDVTFGFSVEGQVLVVWANGVSGLDTSAIVWNDSIGLDLKTGERYTAYSSLLREDAGLALSKLLPEGTPYYTYPRMDAGGVTFFRNYSAEKGGEPYAESIRLTFQQLADAIDFNGSCYKALLGTY